MIDTAEKRRSVIDFGRAYGTGMPVPKGSIDAPSRIHIVNMYGGITLATSFFFGWRNRVKASGFWQNCVEARD